MIGKVAITDFVVALDHELPFRSTVLQYGALGGDCQGMTVEQDMAVGTEAQQVVQRVGAVVWDA